MKYALIASVAAFLATTSLAQADTMDPCMMLGNLVTRPTVTNSACVVEADHALLEVGYANLSFSGSGNTVTAPEALVRIGTEIKHLEVDLQAPSENHVNGMYGQSDGGGGLKYLLGYSPRMQYSVQYAFTEPTGNAMFTAGASQSIFSLNTNYAFSPVFTLSTSQNFSNLASNGIHYGSYTPTLFLSASLPHNFGALGEVALSTDATGPQTPTRFQYFLGSTYDVNARLQLDVEDTFSPTKSTGRYNGVGFGLAYFLH